MILNNRHFRKLALVFVISLLPLSACQSDSNDEQPSGPCQVSRNDADTATIVDCPGSDPVEVQDVAATPNNTTPNNNPDEPCEEANNEVNNEVDPVDPATADFDQDGVTEADGDCDDFNNLIFPGAREVSFDGIDRNCDGDDKATMNIVEDAALLEALDLDDDDEISLEEFEVACANSAILGGDARPGVVQIHAACAGVNSCRGMVLQDWGEVYVHDCRAVNYCKGWSCVEAGEDQGREGAELFDAGSCGDCHGGESFTVHVPPGEEPEGYVAGFFDQGDRKLVSAIAFGKSGVAANGLPYSNMPAVYSRMSPNEMDTLLAYIKTLPTETSIIEYPTLTEE